MNLQNSKKSLWLKRSVAVLCLALMVVSAILVPEIVAKYKSQASGSDSAAVAQFVLDSNMTEKSQTIQLTGLSPSSELQSFQFVVTNKKNGKISEVAMKYTVEIKGLGNLPLIYTVSDGTTTQKNTSHVSVSNSVEANTAATHNYTVTVGWNKDDDTNNDAKYTEEIDLVTVTLRCEQID